MLWFKNYSLEEIEKYNINMGLHLGIVFTEITENSISAKMPVDHRTQQPMGLLHGGASVVLAESLGSIGAALTVDLKTHYAVGQSIYAHHLKSATQGFVVGTATCLHKGKKSQIWDIDVVHEDGYRVCNARLTVAILERK